MEYDKIINFLGSPRHKLPKFVTKKWIKVHNQSNERYDDKRQIRFKTSKLRSDLCDCSDAYILVKGTITVTSQGNVIRDKKNRPLVLKNNAPVISCISKINNKLIENAEDLDIVMPMYNLLEYSKNHRKTTGSLFNYYRGELSDDVDNNNSPKIKVIKSKSFKYKTSITGNTYEVVAGADGYDDTKEGTKETELALPLKYLGNFWKSLDIPLINCEVSLNLAWDKNCVITSRESRLVTPAHIGNQEVRDNSPTGATFKIDECVLYVPVVTLSKNDKDELLNNLKSGFKRIITWNKYLSQMSNQSANTNLNFLTDPTFTNANRLFVLSYENDDANRDNRTSYSKYYLPEVQIKGFNVLIAIKSLENEAYEKCFEITRNSEYNTANLLDYEYFRKFYRLIAIDLSKQHELEKEEDEDIRQQINFIGRLEGDAAIFFIIEKKEKTTIEFSQNSANVLYK